MPERFYIYVVTGDINRKIELSNFKDLILSRRGNAMQEQYS